MYTSILLLHSWLRWFVILFIVIVLIKFLTSLLAKKPYTTVDRILSSALLGTVHLQFVLGIILYFGLSPIVQEGLANFKAAMKNPTLRYWTVEHFSAMFLFVVLVQIGFSLSKRAIDSSKKHSLMVIFTGLAFVLLLLSLPWPMREYGRALFR